jgi:hypothetical protein
MFYIVYKTTNIINNKIYIGVHKTKNPDIFDGYIGCGVNKKDRKKKDISGFPAAVKKYGYENFKRETLFVFPYSDEGYKLAYEKEAELVNEEFINRPDTYNRILGGKPGRKIEYKIAQYSLDGEFIKIWNSESEASEFYKLTSLRACISGISKYCGDYQWRKFTGDMSNISPVEKKEKTVYQFDLQGNLLKVWKSASEAAKSFENPTSAKTAIHQGIKRKAQSYGYYWSNKCKFDLEPPKGYAAVAKYNDAGEFLGSYSSISEAARENNIKSMANIIAAIKGTQKRCGGFRWRYFYGNTSNIKSL